MPAKLSAIFGRNTESQYAPPSFIGKVVLWIAIIVGVLLMAWLAGTFALPAEPGFSASLLQQNSWVVSLFVVAIGMVVVMFASAAVTRSLRSDAPIFCTALACGVISWRGGTMQYTLFAADGPRVFFSLAMETIILFAALVAAWELLVKLRGPSPSAAPTSEQPIEEGSLDEKLLATFTHAALMMAIMILLCRTDSKDQSLASVFISSAAAAAVAIQLVNVRCSFWLWIGPLAVAVFGYVFAYFHAEGWQTGVLHGPLAALARPLPLDYLSMGPAGAVFGYWMSGGGETEEELPDVDAAATS